MMLSSERNRTGIVGVTILLLAVASWLSTTTEAAALACGDVITEDTTLEHNLLDCPDDGLIIGADNVTLRLNGFMIDHFNNAAEASSELMRSMSESMDSMEDFISSIIAQSSPVGIYIDGYERINILGPGVIRDFSMGVTARLAKRVRVFNLSLLNTSISLVESSTGV